MKQVYVKIIGRQDMRLLKRKEDIFQNIHRLFLNEYHKAVFQIPHLMQGKLNELLIMNEIRFQTNSLIEYDRVTFSILQDNVLSNKRHFCVPITSFVNDSSLYLQSLSYVNGTPLYLIIISESLKFDAFHLGVKCYVNSLSKNLINTVHRWSTLEEVIRFSNFKELNNKMVVMIEQMAAMSATPACTTIYDADIIVRAFEIFLHLVHSTTT